MDLNAMNVTGKKVLIRVDFNVPLSPNGSITDDTRIVASLPTIKWLLDHGASVILMSHLGRPKGKVDPKLSLAPCARRLGKLIKNEVLFASDTIGPNAKALVSNLKPGQILVLENLRFDPAEEKPSLNPQFAANLADLADLYVNDAFGSAHRAHSSTVTIAKLFKGKAAPGLLMQKEIEFLGSHLSDPKRPFYAIIGGAKVSSKLDVLNSLLKKADSLFIGGAMAYTFLKSQGYAIGSSLCEDDLLQTAADFLEAAKKEGVKIHLPLDLVIADQFSLEANKKIITIADGIPEHWEGMDIGPLTIAAWTKALEDGQTILWNGPLGVFELAPFAKGTAGIAKALSKSQGITIIGGGDSVAAITQMGLAKNFSHLSTGGGASLEYIEQGHLPGIDALD